MEIKRVRIFSAVKIGGALYACMGLLVGCIVGLFMLVGGVAATASGDEAGPLAAVFGMGIGIVIVAPIFYGVMGAILGLVTSFIYNMVASLVGGLEFDVK